MPFVYSLLFGALLGAGSSYLSWFVFPDYVPSFFLLIAGIAVSFLGWKVAATSALIFGRRMEMAALALPIYATIAFWVCWLCIGTAWVMQHLTVTVQ